MVSVDQVVVEGFSETGFDHVGYRNTMLNVDVLTGLDAKWVLARVM